MGPMSEDCSLKSGTSHPDLDDLSLLKYLKDGNILVIHRGYDIYD